MNDSRTILHSDMNAFYYSVEAMLDPKLRGKAVAVCGSTENRHGIVLAKSELAKKAGVKTGMANWEARQCCPDLIMVPPHYDQYVKYSRLAHEIYCRFTDQVEPYGMDECWVDVTGSRVCGNGMEIAQKIRKDIREELGLTVSIGVSFNKIFAKLGSDRKKPDAVTEITADNYKEKVWPLPVTDLLYVGSATGRKLTRYGVRTIGALASTDPETLRGWFGVNGIMLWRFASGLDESRVMPVDYVSPVKSVGHGITCSADLTTPEEVFKVLLELSQDVGHRLRLHELSACGVQISIRDKNLCYFQYQCPLPARTQLPGEIAKAGYQLFRKRYFWNNPVRAVTIRAIRLVPQNSGEQLSLFLDNERREKRVRLEDAVEDIRRRFGKKAITYGILMGDLKMPEDKRDMVRMPSMMYQ